MVVIDRVVVAAAGAAAVIESLPGPLLSSSTHAILGADVGVVGVVTEADPLSHVAVLDLDVHLHALGPGPEVQLDLGPVLCSTSTAQPLAGVAVTSRRLPDSTA